MVKGVTCLARSLAAIRRRNTLRIRRNLYAKNQKKFKQNSNKIQKFKKSPEMDSLGF